MSYNLICKLKKKRRELLLELIFSVHYNIVAAILRPKCNIDYIEEQCNESV